MWEQLNSFYDVVQKLDKSDIEPSQLPRTCAILRSHCLSQIGIAVCSLFRDEGYTFFNLGMLIERADQTSRLLDVKYARVVTGTPPKSASDGPERRLKSFTKNMQLARFTASSSTS